MFRLIDCPNNQPFTIKKLGRTGISGRLSPIPGTDDSVVARSTAIGPRRSTSNGQPPKPSRNAHPPGRNNNDAEGTASTRNVDFSSSYNINDHFPASLEALNITDEVQDQWVGEAANRLSYYHHQGTQYFLGARFKY
jgi:outer membrane receptor protein involved in Fe transport